MKIAIGPSSFAAEDQSPKRLLIEGGFEVINNPYGRKLTEDEIVELLQGACGLIAGLEPLTSKVVAACPDLRAIARVGIGMDNVDQQACLKYGIKVSNTPDGPTAAVAEMVLTALLDLARGISRANASMHGGEWKKEIGFSVSGLKVLIIGAGRIGLKVRELLSIVGCDVKTFDSYALSDFTQLAEGLAWAEAISLHASGNDEIIGVEELKIMRDGVIILNSARGALINEDALCAALDSGKVRGCWMDVYQDEPYKGRLVSYGQAVLTPHIATYTRQCRLSMETEAVENLLRDLATHV